MTITVHHLEFSRSLRVLWLLEELGLEYSIRRYARDTYFRAPPELAAIHPLGRAPVVEVDGQVLAESGAILEYFVEREGKLRPLEQPAQLQYRFFLHYAEGSTMTPLLVQLLVTKLREASMPFFAKPIARSIAGKIESSYSMPAIALHFGFVNDTLATRPYFAGDTFSAADIQMFYPIEVALSRGKGDWPNIKLWRERVTGREAYGRAERAGGTATPSDTNLSGEGNGMRP